MAMILKKSHIKKIEVDFESGAIYLNRLANIWGLKFLKL